MTILDIPYRSQWDPDANDHFADCGPTCLAMILNYYGVSVTTDGLYDHIPEKGPYEFTKVYELIDASSVYQVPLTWQQYGDQNAAFANLRANIDAGNPIIALVKYKPWREKTGHNFEGGHFVVVTGYDDQNVTFHDPLFGKMVVPREKGAHLAFSYDDFAAGWNGFPDDENPNWACAVAGQIVSIPAPGTPQPQPQPVPTPPPGLKPPATPTPQIPPDTDTASDGRMEDANRRVLALAAYRWAAAPNVDDPAEMELWLDHLGDWGLEYDKYVVQAGDTFAGIAARFYGEQHRWHAIQLYNEIGREGLLLGETLLIPRHGQSGAHKDPALPHDTTDFTKDIDFDLLVDPDQQALDYNSLAANTKGIGFFD